MRKINLHCPINKTSYGYVSSYIMKEIQNIGYDVRHLPIGQTQLDEEIVLSINNKIDENFDTLKIWHQHDLASIAHGKKLYGYPIFELEEFTDIEKISLNHPDELFVTSQWAKDVVMANTYHGPNTVHVAPLGVNNDIFHPEPLPNNPVTIFGNFGKFETRKGHDVLIQAFEKAFDPDDAVALVMMPTNFFLSESETKEWITKYKSSKIGHRVQLIPRVENQSMVYNIMKQIHCGVFPARAEGWNLEALEILASGRHLIITDCTAHTEFCNSDNSRLINMESGYEPALDYKFFNGQFNWRKFGNSEMDQLVNHLREVHKLNMEGNLSINKKGVETGKKFSWKNTAEKIDLVMGY